MHSAGDYKPVDLPQVFYIKSDITKIRGAGYMRTFKMQPGIGAIRVHCKKCASILEADHPLIGKMFLLDGQIKVQITVT